MFSIMAGYLLDASDSPFFGKRPEPCKFINNVNLDDKNDLNDLLKMLENGKLNNKYNAAQILARLAVSEDICNKLVILGFPKIAFEIAVELLTCDYINQSDLTLLRCIMITISSIVSFIGPHIVTECGMDSFVKSICTNQEVFTNEMESLLVCS